MNISKTTIQFPKYPPAVWVYPDCHSLAEVEQAERDKVRFNKKADKAQAAYSEYRDMKRFVNSVASYGTAVADLDQTPDDWASEKEGVVVLRDATIQRSGGGAMWDRESIDAEMKENGDFTVFAQGDDGPRTYTHTVTPTGDKYERISNVRVETVIVDNKKGTMTHIEEPF